MKFVIATKNEHKLVEFKRILNPLGIEVLSQSDVNVDIEVEETGTTFEQNARLKAMAIFKATSLATIADDSGLEVDALDGQPGVYSARYGGSGLDDTKRCDLVLQKLLGVENEKRTARFVSCIYLVCENGEEHSFFGKCEGRIAHSLHGDNGFGYDPIFMVGDKSFAQLDEIGKDKISHRGNALKMLEAFLNEK
ncbi:MAG: RdgB/HAM1 family non-canonical purine NTP pyrophosphatase [Oscillospiraceae bacterium]